MLDNHYHAIIETDIAAEGRSRRNELAVEVHITYGYTLKEIADCLGIHYTKFSKGVSDSRQK
nr:hypothetical protein [Desulfobulbaceae bacterium]